MPDTTTPFSAELVRSQCGRLLDQRFRLSDAEFKLRALDVILRLHSAACRGHHVQIGSQTASEPPGPDLGL